MRSEVSMLRRTIQPLQSMCDLTSLTQTIDGSSQIDHGTGATFTLLEQCQGFFKSAFNRQFFKDLSWWSGRSMNSRLPAEETHSLPTELTGRR